MKREYVRPKMVGEQFVANEYCSTCGPTGQTTYKFVCDAPAGTVYVTSGRYQDKYPGYSPCKKTHEVTVKTGDTLPFYEGWVDYDGDQTQDDNETAVIWLETTYWGGVWDGHATAKMSVKDIETLKS